MATLSPSSTTVACKRYKTQSEEALNPSFADLPSCLLEVIMYRLVLKDNIIASAACKSWLEAAVSVRVVEKHPWLLCFPKRGNLLKLYDPFQWKSYSLNLPELADSTVCCSRDGWLLMRRCSSKDMFFFNPFSRDLVSLPQFDLSFVAITFSCPPTADHCVVGIVSTSYFNDEQQEGVINFSTCHLGATEWITEDLHFQVTFESFESLDMHCKLIYLHNQFYFFHCFQGVGSLHSFDPSSRTWDFHFNVSHHEHRMNFKKKVLAEKNGELFLMLTSSSGNEKPLVYKLVSLNGEKMSPTELDGLTIFVSFYNSELRTNLPWMRNNVFSFYNSELRTNLPWMRNNVYFSRFGYNRKSCLSYSFDKSRYNSKWNDWIQLCPRQSIWVNPPDNVLNYL